jgi:hypothetical protein
MSATPNHEDAVSDLPENQPGFFFSLQSDDSGVTELRFRKDVQKVFGTLLFAIDYINQSFDEPFSTVGEFLRQLAEIADKVKEQAREREAQVQEVTDDGQANPDPAAT